MWEGGGFVFNFLQLKITFLLMHAPWGHEESGGGGGGGGGESAQPQKVRCLSEMASGSARPCGGPPQH